MRKTVITQWKTNFKKAKNTISVRRSSATPTVIEHLDCLLSICDEMTLCLFLLKPGWGILFFCDGTFGDL